MLSDLRIIPRFFPAASPDQLSRADRLAIEITNENAGFAEDKQFASLVPQSLTDGACLLLDDLSEIQLLDDKGEFLYMQDRCRLRAGNGDAVATVVPETLGYEDYCRDFLNLGTVDWFRPVPTANPMQIAHACWEDRKVRNDLLHRLRNGSLHYIHPHMGTLGVWELAALLHEHSRRPIKVIAPRPGVARLANNKIRFASIIRRLFGDDAVPVSASAWNLATLAQKVMDLRDTAQMLGFKRPDSAGGNGIVVLQTEKLRNKPLIELHSVLLQELAPLHWDDGCEVLVGAWETDVLCSPSAQIWIPPVADGPPIVEGLFTQHMKKGTNEFDGTGVVEFPPNVTEKLTTSTWLVARLFQQLGYIGRCSFDTILTGSDLESAKVEFIECNGRWGGTSVPMTLMNRLFVEEHRRPFAVQSVQADRLNEISFNQLVQTLGDHVYDHRTGKGDMIFYTPARMQVKPEITVLQTADSWRDAEQTLRNTVPALLRRAVKQATADTCRQSVNTNS